MAAVTFSHRHLVILALGAAFACGGRHANVAPAPSAPAETVDQFLAAVNANDLDRMASLWGDARGPSNVVNAFPVTERNKRLTIMQRLLQSDAHQVVGTDVGNPEQTRLSVLITVGTRRFAVPFTMVQSRYGGWLVKEIGLDAAMPTAGGRSN
jgi:hypothetical protein